MGRGYTMTKYLLYIYILQYSHQVPVQLIAIKKYSHVDM